jgi:hypothetical protein
MQLVITTTSKLKITETVKQPCVSTDCSQAAATKQVYADKFKPGFNFYEQQLLFDLLQYTVRWIHLHDAFLSSLSCSHIRLRRILLNKSFPIGHD